MPPHAPADPALTASAEGHHSGSPVPLDDSDQPLAPLPFEPMESDASTPDTPVTLHWTQLDVSMQQRVAALEINVIHLGESAEDAWALINMQRYRAGDRLPGEFYLLEIREQSLLLQFGPTRFELPIQR